MSRTPGCLICVESSGGVLTVSVESEKLRDLTSVACFERELRDLAEARAETRWIVDFKDHTFFFTPAANTLLAQMRRLRQRGGDLVLAGLTPDVQYVLRLLRLNTLFTAYPTVAAARSALAQIDDHPPTAEAV